MNPLRTKPLLRLLALLAMLIFAGDLAADAISDALGGHCDVQTSQSAPDHEKSPCSHCACAVHAGAVVLADSPLGVTKATGRFALLRGSDDARPVRRSAAIDHPPQLA